MGFIRQDIKTLPTNQNIERADQLDRERAKQVAPHIGEDAINASAAPVPPQQEADAPKQAPGSEVQPQQPGADGDVRHAA